MQEKQAIITLNYGYETNAWYKYMREVFIPSIQQYAKRISVDFILMNNKNNRFYDTWNQLQFTEYLDYYDRVMYIDGDCYIPKLFRQNFFNKIEKEKIGLYENTKAIEPQCNLVFIAMLLNKSNRHYLTPPPVYEQKHKWESKDSMCYFGKPIYNACYYGEECFINECINKFSIHDKIEYLTGLYVNIDGFMLINNITQFNNQNKIYHIRLKQIFDRNTKWHNKQFTASSNFLLKRYQQIIKI